MRITHISDTHNKHNQLNGKLPGGQLLIHSGDFTSIGRKHEVEKFIEWFSKQDYTHKVFIAGNHDLTFQSERMYEAKSAHFEYKEYPTPGAEGKPEWLVELLSNLPDSVYYLENSSIKLEGINIWGSPHSPSFGYGWAFNKDRGNDIAQCWNEIPMDTDIVITHTPIYGYSCVVDGSVPTKTSMYVENSNTLNVTNCLAELSVQGQKTIYVTKEPLYSKQWGMLRGMTHMRGNTSKYPAKVNY